MAPILVTGVSGQLARALAGADPSVRCMGRPRFDFDRPDTIAAAFHSVGPRLVVNAAAYTAVDTAEDEPEAAYRANRDGPALLARLCAESDTPLIHISTDYVFDGAKGAPYVETDPVSPQCVYGASKLAGERAVLETQAKAVILRTAWVYAADGKNFVRTMLTVGKTRERLTVVADQTGCPTAAGDLAAAVLGIARTITEAGWQPHYGGVFHAVGAGDTSWHGFATAIFAEAARHGARIPEVVPIATSAWPTRAKRPADSRLDCRKLANVFGIRLPPWQGSLARTIDTILASEPTG